MTFGRLDDILRRMKSVRVGVLGDFCLDAYWDMDESDEVSIETGLLTRSVVGQRYAPGGAGNVAANLASLGCQVSAFGIVGNDLFGTELVRILNGLGITHQGILRQANTWETAVYAKPHTGRKELGRIDFGRRNAMTTTLAGALGDLLRESLSGLDALVINQQLKEGLWSGPFPASMSALLAAGVPCPVVCDVRSDSLRFPGVIMKMNEAEAVRRTGLPDHPAVETASVLHRQSGMPVFVTCGKEGIVVSDGTVTHIPAVRTTGPLDTVGAGDTAVAAIAGSIAAGASTREAAMCATVAAGVTISKIGRTGTASPAEVVRCAAHHPMLSDAPAGDGQEQPGAA